MKSSLNTFVLLTVVIAACTSRAQDSEWVELTFPAADSVALFAEGIISTGYFQRDFALSPSGDELFYSVQHPRTGFAVLLSSKKIKDKWSLPEIASFSGNYTNFEPAFSPDGKRLYFSSNRPKEEGAESKDFDIWFVEKINDSWGTPQNVGSPVNSDKNEFYPSVAANGNIYFTADRPGAVGREDIFVSRFENGQYTEPVALDTAINSPLYEFNAFVSPDEDFLIFSSFGRKDDMGRGDLYISFKDSTGNWMPAMNLGDKINSKYLDYCPFVSADKKLFFFTSDRMDSEIFSNKNLNFEKFKALADGALNGSGNIYIVDFSELLKLRN
jgi:Tol biopolymer transport system component